MLALIPDRRRGDAAELDSFAGVRPLPGGSSDTEALDGLVSVLSAPRPPAAIFPRSLRERRLVLEQPEARPGRRRLGLRALLFARRTDPAPPTGGGTGPSAAGAVPAPVAQAPAARAPRTSPGAGGQLFALIAGWAGRTAIAATGLALVATLLLVFVPMVMPVQAFPVVSGSMTPTIQVGSLAFVTRTQIGELRVGDVISFQPPGRPGVIETHRIVSLQPGPTAPLARTKGDANARPDPWLLRLTGVAWRYDFSIPYAGNVVLMAKSNAGRIALLGVPGAALVLLYLAEFLRRRPGRREG